MNASGVDTSGAGASAVAPPRPATLLAEVNAAGRALRLEYAWIDAARRDAPLIVFLHEGLGSVAMWRDWPARLCAATGCRGLVYSRAGYGRSTPRARDERWPAGFMHHEARTVLPALLAALGVDARAEPPILFGHSDGASIALLYAAAHPDAVAGVAVAAPHILVEPVTLASIAQAREAYLHTDLRARLARHHDDPDSAFWGWNDVWLSPAFAAWNITAELDALRCPVLAIQGLDDEYGSLEQIRGIRRRAPQTRLLEIAACRHSPHKDQPEAVLQAMRHFVDTLPTRRAAPSGGR